jgi:hypothetical protein
MRCVFLPLACLGCFASSLACGGAVDEEQLRCDDVTSQIDQALANYTDSENLLPGAVACELTPASFDPRVSPENVERVLGQFTAACDIQAQTCSGAPARVGPPRDIPPYEQPPDPATSSPEPVTNLGT